MSQNKKFIYFVLFSVLAHMGFLYFKHFPKYASSAKQSPRKKNKTIKIKLAKKKKEETKKVKSNKKPQIVQNDLNKNNLNKKSTRFLSKDDQAYARQSLARKVDLFKKASKGERNGSKSQGRISRDSIQKKTLDLYKLAAKGTLDSSQFKKSKLDGITPKGLKTGKGITRTLSSTNDFIDDIPLGDFTKLNTVKYKYYGFYHRIRQKLEQFWGSTIKDKSKELYKKDRALLGGKNHITSLKVYLDNKGRIIKVNLQGSSGVKELDDAAIESFNRAGPFPNPPQGMLNEGVAKIEWGFVVKT